MKLWTDWPQLEHERLPHGRTDFEPPSYLRRTAAGREELLAIRRLALAHAEAAAWRLRLHEERLVADTAIRALHLRVDSDADFVRLATGLTFHPPGSLAHSQCLIELERLVKERRRHQSAPHQTDEAERAADASLAEGWREAE